MVKRRVKVKRSPTLVQRLRKDLHHKAKQARKDLREAERDLRSITRRKN